MEKTKLQLAFEKASNLVKFFSEKLPAENKESFKSIKVKDSDQEVEVAELKVGADVSVSGSTGSLPAPDQKWLLVDGSEFTTKGGKVESIEKEAEEAVDEPKKEDAPAKEELADEPVAEPVKEDVSEPADDIKTLTDRVSKLEEAIAAIMEVIQMQPSAEDVSEFNSKVKEFNVKVENLSKLPTQMSADSRAEMKESEMEKYSRIADSYKK